MNFHLQNEMLWFQFKNVALNFPWFYVWMQALPTANKSSGDGRGKKSVPPKEELEIKGLSSSAERINSGLQEWDVEN